MKRLIKILFFTLVTFSFSGVQAQQYYPVKINTDDFSITDAGKVRLKQTYFLKDVQTYIENPENPVDRTILSEFDATFDPFEPVTLIVVKNYPGIRLDKETQLILPAYTAFLIKELIRENQWDQTERVALNSLEIGAAFFSGGLSSIGTFTLRAAATVAAMDLYVQEELQSLNSGEYTEKEVFINRWNAFKATVDIADAGVGGVSLYRNLPSLMDKTVRVKAWKQLNGILKQASALPGNLRIAWKRIATGNIDFSAYPNIAQVGEPSFLTKLDEDLWSHTVLSRLNDDLADATLRAEMGSNPGLVEAWKVIEGNPILRKKSENIENISKWLDEAIEPQKLTDGIAKSKSKQKLIDELGTAKSKLHAQVLIKDYDNIPGVAKGRYTPNGSSLSDKVDLPKGWANDVDLPQDEIKNFTGKIEPLELKQGDRIYRVSPLDKADRPYWTRTKPEKLDDVVGGTAVQPEWNNFEYIHEYVVPDGVTIKSWKGKTARQPLSETTPSNYHLPGGEEQLYIRYISNQDPNFQSIVKSTKAEW